jgi:preprotein translocase subunit SecA
VDEVLTGPPTQADKEYDWLESEVKENRTELRGIHSHLAEVQNALQTAEERERARESAKPEPIRAAPKVGRNDPCGCGSGRKFKKCCGR